MLRKRLRYASDIPKYSICNLEKTVKSRFKDWIPAFAGMTSI